jgi:hypothetical protein
MTTGQWIEKVAIPFIERWWRPLAIVSIANQLYSGGGQ